MGANSGRKWLFDQPPNCGVITMRQVLDREEPILLVTHDADDHGWQFIGTTDACVEDGRLVCLSHMVELDPTICELADLPPGWGAARAGVGMPWVRRRRENEE